MNKPDNVPEDATAVGLDPQPASDGRGLFDVMYRAIGDGSLVDLGGGAHDAVFDVFATAFNRFAAADHVERDEPVGWVWKDDAGDLAFHVRDDLKDRFEHDEWDDDPSEYGYVGYE